MPFCFAIACIGFGISIYLMKLHSVKPMTLPLAGLHFLCMFIATAIIISLIYLLTSGRYLILSFNPVDTQTLLTVMAATLSVIFVELILSILRVFREKNRFPISSPVFLTVFEGMVIFIMLVAILNPQLTDSGINNIQYRIAFLFLFLSSCLTVFLISNSIERTEAKQLLDDEKRRSELEQIQYADIEKQRTRLLQISNQYDTILTKVLKMIENDDIDQARRLLNELSVRIEATREYPFCSIPVINAVLTEKKTDCTQKNIRFSVDLMLPDHLPIRDIDLCIALGNLLDNSIHACKKIIDNNTSQPEIILNGRVVHGYLVIKCVNSIYNEDENFLLNEDRTSFPNESENFLLNEDRIPFPNRNENASHHNGYGLKILNDIAQHYEGDFFTEQENDIFTAQLSLPVNKYNNTR